MVERIVIEGRPGQNFLSMLQDAEGHSDITTLGRDQLSGVVGGEFFHKKEVGGGDGVAQELDALANERGDDEKLFRRGLEAGLLEEGLEQAAELVDGQGADVLGVEPDSFRVERVLFGKVDYGVGAIDRLESESGGELVEREKLAVVLR